MEEQAKGLAEMVGNETDRQLKELYDSLSAEDKERAEYHASNEVELKCIKFILNSYGIPASQNGVELSLSERVRLALKLRMTA